MMQLHKEHFSDLYYLQTQAVPRLRKKKALNLLTISLDFFNCTANPSFSNTFQKTSFITLLEWNTYHPRRVLIHTFFSENPYKIE